jgi:hypothetical protein
MRVRPSAGAVPGRNRARRTNRDALDEDHEGLVLLSLDEPHAPVDEWSARHLLDAGEDRIVLAELSAEDLDALRCRHRPAIQSPSQLATRAARLP